MVVQADLTHADGHGERKAALKMINRHSPDSTRRLSSGRGEGSSAWSDSGLHNTSGAKIVASVVVLGGEQNKLHLLGQASPREKLVRLHSATLGHDVNRCPRFQRLRDGLRLHGLRPPPMLASKIFTPSDLRNAV